MNEYWLTNSSCKNYYWKKCSPQIRSKGWGAVFVDKIYEFQCQKSMYEPVSHYNRFDTRSKSGAPHAYMWLVSEIIHFPWCFPFWSKFRASEIDPDPPKWSFAEDRPIGYNWSELWLIFTLKSKRSFFLIFFFNKVSLKQ